MDGLGPSFDDGYGYNDGEGSSTPDGDTVMEEADCSHLLSGGPMTRARSREIRERLKNLPTFGDIYPPEYFRQTYYEPELPPFLRDKVSKTYDGPTLGELMESGYKISNPFPDGYFDKHSESTTPDRNLWIGGSFNFLDEQKLHPPQPRKSPRMSKLAGRYGFAGGPTPLPPEHKHLSCRKNSAKKISKETYEIEFAKLNEKYGTSHFFKDSPAAQNVNRGPSTIEPVVDKYVAAGNSREAVFIAVREYGDNPVKVLEFVEKFNRLREMVPDPPEHVAEALLVHAMDMDKALAVLSLLRNNGKS